MNETIEITQTTTKPLENFAMMLFTNKTFQKGSNWIKLFFNFLLFGIIRIQLNGFVYQVKSFI